MGGRYRGGRSGGDLDESRVERFLQQFEAYGVSTAIAHEVYSDNVGERTLALYRWLEKRGAAFTLAKHLFRAHKVSGRAKEYRGGFKGKAYARKGESLAGVATILVLHADAVGIRWGWKIDPKQARHSWVLYVDLPTGQVSFHSAHRDQGPDYDGEWDGQHGVGDLRICRYIGSLAGEPVVPVEGRRVVVEPEQQGLNL